MNTHDIELPPLPLHPSVAHMGGRHMQADCQFPSLYVWAKNYARAAIEPYVETLFKIGEHLGIDYQEARTAPGKPSDVYIAAIEADRKRRGEPVAWPEIELTPEQDEKYNSWVGSDNRKGFERMVARLAYKLNTSGRGLIDYDAAQHFATELRTIFALAASPQPAENSVNLEVAIQAISALHSNDTDWDTSYWNQAVGRCVSELNKLRSQRPAEPVKVPSDAEMAAIWDEAHKPFGGAPFLMSHVEYSRALLARYGQPTAREDADDLYVAYLCGLADGKKTTNTLPTPKPDPHYEEGATDVFDHAQRQAYVDGWNECLEAIKKGLKRT